MGCSSSKEMGEVDLEVFRGQQARRDVKLSLESEGFVGAAKGLKDGKKSITWVQEKSKKKYQISSKIIDINKNGYRKQSVESVDRTKYCYFLRTFNPYLRSHNYQCRAADDSRTLFSVFREGGNDLIVEITNSYDPDNSNWRARHVNGQPHRLKMDFRGGKLMYKDPQTGMIVKCGHITRGEVKVASGMDQVVCFVLAAIVAEIKELNGLMLLAQLATPAPAKGATGVAMRGATYMMQTDPNARGAARGREDIAFQAVGDFAANTSKGKSFSDSAYASANTSIASSREVSRNRQGQGPQRGRNDDRGRSQSRGRSQGSRSTGRQDW